jgi:hypothetical protein
MEGEGALGYRYHRGWQTCCNSYLTLEAVCPHRMRHYIVLWAEIQNLAVMLLHCLLKVQRIIIAQAKSWSKMTSKSIGSVYLGYSGSTANWYAKYMFPATPHTTSECMDQEGLNTKASYEVGLVPWPTCWALVWWFLKDIKCSTARWGLSISVLASEHEWCCSFSVHH